MSIACKTCLVLPICRNKYEYYYEHSVHEVFDPLINMWYHCNILKQWFEIHEESYFVKIFRDGFKTADKNKFQQMLELKNIMENK